MQGLRRKCDLFYCGAYREDNFTSFGDAFIKDACGNGSETDGLVGGFYGNSKLFP